MRIAWYDRGLINQGSAIPRLPRPEDTPFVFSEGLKQTVANVVGNEMWRVPVLHELYDDGHQIIWFGRRRVMPSEDLDFDLSRLVDLHPEFEPFVRERDPMLDAEGFDMRGALLQRYVDEVQNASGVNGDAAYAVFRGWFEDRVFGVPPSADVLVIAAMGADVVTSWEQAYLILHYIDEGTPVVLWDQDRQLATTRAMFVRMGREWPHPLVTIVGPYDADVTQGRPKLIDYPYVEKFETPIEDVWSLKRMPPTVCYVGNDYDRRDAMESLLFPMADRMEVHVWGKYDSADAVTWKARWSSVSWMGRIESCRAPEAVRSAFATVNIVKKNYRKIGLLTMRTFDSNCYGTLQVGDARIERLSTWVPEDFLVSTVDEAVSVAEAIADMDETEYLDALERQRALTRRNGLRSTFMPRLYELIDAARHTAVAQARDGVR